MSEEKYTPNTLYISGLYATDAVRQGDTLQTGYAEFYRWLDKVKQETFEAWAGGGQVQ
jgi:hypothetical protein